MAYSKSLIKILAENTLNELLIGENRFLVYKPEQLEGAQAEYSNNSAVCWKADWVVFSCEESFNDPIFVDVSNESLPVYTIAWEHGDGEPIAICNSLISYLQILGEISSSLNGTSTLPEALARDIIAKESGSIIDKISKTDESANIAYWEDVFSEFKSLEV